MYSIRLEGDVRGLLHKMKNFSDIDKRKLNAVLSEANRTSTLERFKQQKDPQGKSWKSSIRVIREGGVTLSKSAALKNSIHSRADSSGFAVGTNKIYAATHQLGDKGRKITIRAKTSKGLVFQINGKWIRKRMVKIKVDIPKREYLGLSEDDMQEIKHTTEEFIGRD